MTRRFLGKSQVSLRQVGDKWDVYFTPIFTAAQSEGTLLHSGLTVREAELYADGVVDGFEQASKLLQVSRLIGKS